MQVLYLIDFDTKIYCGNSRTKYKTQKSFYTESTCLLLPSVQQPIPVSPIVSSLRQPVALPTVPLNYNGAPDVESDCTEFYFPKYETCALIVRNLSAYGPPKKSVRVAEKWE